MEEAIGKLILRLGFGGMMLTHGWPKLEKLLAGGEIKFSDPFGIGPGVTLALVVFAEFICAILLIIGYKTRLAAIPLIITMAVAGFYIHAEDAFSSKEKAFLYLAGFIVIALIGPGKYSLDYKTSKFQMK
jgi:putative oxidoreductase